LSYPFQPRVVRRVEEGRRRHEVSQEERRVVRGAGQSVPWSTIQPTVLERGGEEKRRAPRAE
jgi:hypothetical protein